MLEDVNILAMSTEKCYLLRCRAKFWFSLNWCKSGKHYFQCRHSGFALGIIRELVQRLNLQPVQSWTLWFQVHSGVSLSFCLGQNWRLHQSCSVKTSEDLAYNTTFLSSPWESTDNLSILGVSYLAAACGRHCTVGLGVGWWSQYKSSAPSWVWKGQGWNRDGTSAKKEQSLASLFLADPSITTVQPCAQGVVLCLSRPLLPPPHPPGAKAPVAASAARQDVPGEALARPVLSYPYKNKQTQGGREPSKNIFCLFCLPITNLNTIFSHSWVSMSDSTIGGQRLEHIVLSLPRKSRVWSAIVNILP